MYIIIIFGRPQTKEASLVAQTVKSLPAMQETWIRSLGREDPLEKEMATNSSILAWRISMDRGAWWVTVHRSQRVGHDWGATTHSPRRNSHKIFSYMRPNPLNRMQWGVKLPFSHPSFLSSAEDCFPASEASINVILNFERNTFGIFANVWQLICWLDYSVWSNLLFIIRTWGHLTPPWWRTWECLWPG